MRIITGSPGTGKHTVARIVARDLGLTMVDLGRVARKRGIAKRSRGVLEVDARKLAKVLKGNIPRNALVVGHLAPYAVSGKDVDVCVVLRRSPYSLERSYRARGYSKKKSIENLGAEILGVTYYDAIRCLGKKKTFQIDTTGRPVADTVRRTRRILLGGRAGWTGPDWLGEVKRKGDLKRFFPY